jgi:hypothetical protein
MGVPALDGIEQAGVYSGMGILVVEAMTWQGLGSVALRPAYCSTATGASQAHLGLMGPVGPSVILLLCPANDCLSAVEVGSSRVATRLLFLVPMMSCISIGQAVDQCQATDDGDYKIVVAHASGWPC